MNPSPTDKRTPTPNLPTYQWHSWIWYAVMMLAMLWIWQKSFRQLAVRPIACSEFKQRLANAEVVECAVRVMRTDEEWMIARIVTRVLQQQSPNAGVSA